MASRTQIRLTQLTGSIGNAVGKIRTDIAKSTLAAVKATDLSGSLGVIASAIGRIHGKGSNEAFDNTAGEFYQALKILSSDGLTIGAGGNEFAIEESSDDISLMSMISNKNLKLTMEVQNLKYFV